MLKTIFQNFQQYFGNFHHKFVLDEVTIGCLDLLKAITIGSEDELFDSIDFKSLKIADLAKGCYKKPTDKLPVFVLGKEDIGNLEDLSRILAAAENHQLPFSDILKQKIAKSPESALIKTSSLSSTTSHWLYPVFNYAVALGKASTWQSAHRQSILLKLPFYTPDIKDWFVAALFLATNCNAKLTSDSLIHMCLSDIDIRAFWAASHETLKEFVDYLRTEIWPEVCTKVVSFEEKPKFGALVNFVYRCGLGCLDFRGIEEYLLAVIWGGKQAVVSK